MGASFGTAQWLVLRRLAKSAGRRIAVNASVSLPNNDTPLRSLGSFAREKSQARLGLVARVTAREERGNSSRSTPDNQGMTTTSSIGTSIQGVKHDAADTLISPERLRGVVEAAVGHAVDRRVWDHVFGSDPQAQLGTPKRLPDGNYEVAVTVWRRGLPGERPRQDIGFGKAIVSPNGMALRNVPLSAGEVQDLVMQSPSKREEIEFTAFPRPPVGAAKKLVRVERGASGLLEATVAMKGPGQQYETRVVFLYGNGAVARAAEPRELCGAYE